jgi:hypothetical protein
VVLAAVVPTVRETEAAVQVVVPATPEIQVAARMVGPAVVQVAVVASRDLSQYEFLLNDYGTFNTTCEGGCENKHNYFFG